MNGYRGYISSGPLNGSLIPQRVQNLVIRDYAQRKGLHFLLSAAEYNIPNSATILRGILRDLPNLDGIIFYSTHLIPTDNTIRISTFDTILAAGKELHFALEELVLHDRESRNTLDAIIRTRHLAQTPQGMERLDLN